MRVGSSGHAAAVPVKKRRLAAAEARAKRRRNIPDTQGATVAPLPPGIANIDGPASASLYKPLDPSLTNGPLRFLLKDECSEDSLEAASAAVLTDLLHGSRAASAAALRLAEKVLLLENPTAAKRKPPGACSRLVKGPPAKTLYKDGAVKHQFEDLRPLHALWKQHVDSLIQHSRSVQECLLSADLHGCFLRIVSCRQQQGIRGIVVREGSRYLYVVTPQDQQLCVAKQNTVVEWQHGDMIVRLRLVR